MKLLTSYEIATLLDVSHQTVISWIRGWYMRKGIKISYFPDFSVLKVAEGKGIRGNPYLYDLKEAKAYQKRIQSYKPISDAHKAAIGLGQKKRWAKLKVL